MQIPAKIFRDYDIRGIYPTDLNEKSSFLIGKSLGKVFYSKNIKNIVVGRDDRASSPELSKSLMKGLLSTGVNCTYIDITLTPIIHFLTCQGNFDGGIMVTASHNPKEFNGFRIDLKNAVPFYGDELKNLLNIINTGDFPSGEGIYEEANLSRNYLNFMKGNFSYSRKMKVVIDCGSGASSFIAPKLFTELGLEVVPVYCSYDSNFRQGVPDPENPIFLEDLKEEVLKNKADIGFGFDTDGDRFGFVDELGNSYTTDFALLLFSEFSLRDAKVKKVLYDIKCSKVLEDLIPGFGGEVAMIRTGHPYFVESTLAGEVALGAEYSGHVFFSDRYFGYDDGIYAACRSLEILDKTGKKLSELMSKYPVRFSTPEIKLPCADEDKFVIADTLKGLIAQSNKVSKTISIDGVRAELSETGWFLIRASNTSPYLSTRFEGKDKEEVSFLIKYLLLHLSGFEKIDKSALVDFLGSIG